MTDFVKLSTPGDSLTFRLDAVALNTSGNYPDYNLTMQDGRILSAPKSALDRQLAKCNVETMEQLIGSYLTYSRSEKLGSNGHPFHNLAVSSAGEAKQSATPSKRVPPPSKAEAAKRTGLPPEDEIPLPPEPPELQGNARTANAKFPFGANAEQTARSATALGGGDDRDDVQKYTDLMQRIAGALECAVTEANVQGAAATLWIQWHRNR